LIFQTPFVTFQQRTGRGCDENGHHGRRRHGRTLRRLLAFSGEEVWWSMFRKKQVDVINAVGLTLERETRFKSSG